MFSYHSIKRVYDIIGAVFLLVLFAPLLILTAVVVLAVQGRPVFYQQIRVGKDGKPFTLYKYRTMREGPPNRLPDRPIGRVPHDQRITQLGRFLRRSTLDEFPQLINVLRGEMSIVGPRPIPREDLDQPGWLKDIDDEERERRLAWLERRHSVLPGMVGLWQISAEPVDDFDNWVVCDLAYVDTFSFTTDLSIILATPWAGIRGRKAQQPAESSEKRG